MPQDHSFDVVSKVNLQEFRNAVQQAQKEIATRFDFRNSAAGVEFDEPSGVVKLTANDAAQLRSVSDVLTGKLAKRSVPVKSLDWQPPERIPSGAMKQQAKLQQGLSSEHCREVTKLIKSLGLKVQARIEADTVRVSGRQLDELQAVIQALRGKEFEIPIQVENYR